MANFKKLPSRTLILPLKKFIYPKLPDFRNIENMSSEALKNYNPYNEDFIYIGIY